MSLASRAFASLRFGPSARNQNPASTASAATPSRMMRSRFVISASAGGRRGRGRRRAARGGGRVVEERQREARTVRVALRAVAAGAGAGRLGRAAGAGRDVGLV